MPLPVFLKAETVADGLQMTVPQVYELFKTLPPGVAVKLGRRVRVNESAFVKWLEAGGHLADITATLDDSEENEDAGR